jgi:sensor histidine kinase regulating citrate/malate metabolism
VASARGPGPPTPDLATLGPKEPLYEIAKLRALFRTCFLSHAPIGLAVVEQSQKITVANDAFCSLLEQHSDQLVGQRMERSIAPGHRALEREQRDRVLSGELQRWVADLNCFAVAASPLGQADHGG